MDAVSYTATFGIEAGYGPLTAFISTRRAMQKATRAFLEAVCREAEKTKIVVGGVVTVGRVCYPYWFGCPRGGEVVATISGVSNPKFCAPDDFIPAAKRVIADTKAQLNQHRVTLSFSPVAELVYLEPEPPHD